MKKENKISSNRELEIQFLTYKEPNNGRMLWVVDAFLNETKINDDIFKDNWNCLNFKLELWQIENDEFYYIPIEGESILINKTTNEISELKFQGVSTIRFEGNLFHKDSILELYNEGIEITNLRTLKSRTVKWISKGIIKSIGISETEELEIFYKDLDMKELKELSLEVIQTIETRSTLSSNEELDMIKCEFLSLIETKQLNEISKESIDEFYSWFLPTSVWDDNMGQDGEILGNRMLNKLEKLKYGKKETINIK